MTKNYFPLFTALVFCFWNSFEGFAQTDTTYTDADTVYNYIVPEVKTYSLKCITPPVGFEVSDKFNGYISKNSSSTILISVIDGVNYINIQQSITPEHWETQDVVELWNEPFTTDSGLAGILYKLSFVVQKIEMHRYMLLTGDLTKTIWINATYPAQFEALLSPPILDSYKSVRLID